MRRGLRRAKNRKSFLARPLSAVCVTTSRTPMQAASSLQTSPSICSRRWMKRRNVVSGVTGRRVMKRFADAPAKLSRHFFMAAIRESVTKYLAELRRRGASLHTLRSYASDLEQFANYFEPPGIEPPAVEQIDLVLLREWLASVYDQKLTDVTIRRKIGRASCRERV